MPGDKVTWTGVYSFAEVSIAQNRDRIFNTSLTKAYLIFRTQRNRRFVISLQFGRGDFRLHIYDRAGVLQTVAIDVHKNPLLLIRCIASLMLVSNTDLRYDPSITPDTIKVALHTYKIVRLIFASNVLRGRATIYWRVTQDGVVYVIKDTWAIIGRWLSEAMILERPKVKAIKVGVPHVVEQTYVLGGGTECDKTENRRAFLNNFPDFVKSLSLLERRIHTRLVLTPYTDPITSFTSLHELVQAFIDLVGGKQLLGLNGCFANCTLVHKQLVYEAGILHRDISINNIMLYTPPGSSRRHVLLIDYDYADVT